MLRSVALLALAVTIGACASSASQTPEHPRSRIAKRVDTNSDQEETNPEKRQRLIAPPPAYGNRVVEVLIPPGQGIDARACSAADVPCTS